MDTEDDDVEGWRTLFPVSVFSHNFLTREQSSTAKRAGCAIRFIIVGKKIFRRSRFPFVFSKWAKVSFFWMASFFSFPIYHTERQCAERKSNVIFKWYSWGRPFNQLRNQHGVQTVLEENQEYFAAEQSILERWSGVVDSSSGITNKDE